MPSRVRIRQVEPDDLTSWITLRAALWPEQSREELAASAAQFFSALKSGPGTMPEVVFVALDTEAASPALVGFAEVSRRLYAEGCETSPVGFLEGWYVMPEYRRRGVGRALVDACE